MERWILSGSVTPRLDSIYSLYNHWIFVYFSVAVLLSVGSTYAWCLCGHTDEKTIVHDQGNWRKCKDTNDSPLMHQTNHPHHRSTITSSLYHRCHLDSALELHATIKWSSYHRCHCDATTKSSLTGVEEGEDTDSFLIKLKTAIVDWIHTINYYN